MTALRRCLSGTAEREREVTARERPVVPFGLEEVGSAILAVGLDVSYCMLRIPGAYWILGGVLRDQ